MNNFHLGIFQTVRANLILPFPTYQSGKPIGVKERGKSQDSGGIL